MRPLLLGFAVLAVAGCDASLDEVAPLTAPLLVDLVDDGAALRLVTDEITGCYRPLVHETRVGSRSLTVRVEGAAVPTGAECRAQTPSALTVLLPHGDAVEGVDVRIEHLGEADAYRARWTNDGARVLDPVRTSVTRPRTLS